MIYYSKHNNNNNNWDYMKSGSIIIDKKYCKYCLREF